MGLIILIHQITSAYLILEMLPWIQVKDGQMLIFIMWHMVPLRMCVFHNHIIQVRQIDGMKYHYMGHSLEILEQ